MQFYTANGMRGKQSKDRNVYNPHYGFCLETQHYPDSPNKPHFPSPVLHPGEVFQSTTIFKGGSVQFRRISMASPKGISRVNDEGPGRVVRARPARAAGSRAGRR